jgi:hypothetical protein
LTTSSKSLTRRVVGAHDADSLSGRARAGRWRRFSETFPEIGRRLRFAEVVRCAKRYWVQTPNRHFPIEPHVMTLWSQHLPYAAQRLLIARWPLGNHAEMKDPDDALRSAMNIELLSRTQFGFYFPDAEIRKERALGLTKSFIAVKTG